MNILITGVTSFTGSALARELIRRGHSVAGVLRPDSPNRTSVECITGLRLIEADMSDFDKLGDSIPQRFDICIHLCWAGPGRLSRQDPLIQAKNEAAALAMVSSAAKLGCRVFLFSGSQAEYGVTKERVLSGEADGLPVSENTECRPLSEYGKSKLRMLTQCGELSRSLGMRYLHLRIFSAYGEGDHSSSLVSLCCEAFRKGEHLKLSSCDQDWNMLYIVDCARAIAVLAEREASEQAECISERETKEADCVVNVGSEDTRKLYAFVEEMRRICGKGSYELSGSIPSPEGTPWVSPDTSRLRELTGFRPAVSFAEGIRRILAAKTETDAFAAERQKQKE